MMASENSSGVITFPRNRGDIVTHTMVLPTSGKIIVEEMNIETGEPAISFLETVRSDLIAKINVPRLILVDGLAPGHL
jgi:hypothetical protein